MSSPATRSSRRKRARDASEPASSGARRALDATPFTAAEAAQFAEDGFIILRGVIPAAECRRFLRMAVNPAMAKQGILAGDRSTWPREDDEVEDDEGEEGGGAEEAWEEESEASTQATADPDDERAHDLRRGEYDRGICLRGEDGGDHAIPQDDEDSRWPALFGSARLHAVLDSLHGGRDRWSWQHGAAHGVGWIHLRFPVVDGLLWTPPDADSVTGRHCHYHCHLLHHHLHLHLHLRLHSPPLPLPQGVWHIDGDTHRLDTEQSVVVLPLVTPIRPGGGGTALLRGSHKHIGRWLASRGEAGVSRGACRGDEDDEVQV